VLSIARENASSGATVVGVEDTTTNRAPRSESTRQRAAHPSRKTAGSGARFSVLHEIFEEQADARPDEVAVVFGREEVTYAALERRANRIARHLALQANDSHGLRHTGARSQP